MATFGKGLANGYPLSVIAGRSDVMKLMEEVFFSFTFGGECLSLAAAKAVMTKIKTHDTISATKKQGTKLLEVVKGLVKEHGLEDVISWGGHPCWQIMAIRDTVDFKNWEIKTLIMQEMFQRGVLTIGTNNMSYSHGDEELATVTRAYGEMYRIVAEAIRSQTVLSRLRCKPVEPLFKIR
jgi:glutamate-1-semialdehyde 2,1-aminomutase